MPLIFGRNVRAIWQPRRDPGALSNGVVAWRGQNPATQARDMELRLYKLTWDNPWPAEEVVALDFNSAQANAAPFLVALTAEDAQLGEREKRQTISLARTIQGAAPSFPPIRTLSDRQDFEWVPFQINAHAVEIGGRFYDGFRFTTAKEGTRDLIWSFRPAQTPFQGWFILPTTGGLKVGFEDWYHVSPGKQRGGASEQDFVVQFLSGKKLQAGREYFIWFGSDTNQSKECQVALRFAPTGSADPNRPESLIEALGIASATTNFYHRHYCLGAIR